MLTVGAGAGGGRFSPGQGGTVGRRALPRPCSALLYVSSTEKAAPSLGSSRPDGGHGTEAAAAATLEQMTIQSRSSAAVRHDAHASQPSTSEPARQAHGRERHHKQPRGKPQHGVQLWADDSLSSQHDPRHTQQRGLQQQERQRQQQQQQQQRQWPTSAPLTSAAAHEADPRLVALTRRLLAASSPGQLRAALLSEQLSMAELRRLLTYLERTGATDVALAALRAAGDTWQTQPDAPLLWTKLMQMHSKRAKDTGTALAIYRQMRADGCRPDLVTFNTALSAAGRGRQWRAVVGVLADMRQAGVMPDAFTYSALLSACQACGKWEQAVAWFDEIQTAEGVTPNVVHYTTLMTVLQRVGRWEHSISVFQSMETAGVTPDVVAHNAAITAYAKGDDWEKAWAVFAGMRRAGLRPSVVSYNALLNACERCGQPDRALEVFERMQQEGEPKPTAVTYNILISSLGKAARYSEAAALHVRMQAEGVEDDVWTLTALITAAERGAEADGGGWQAALSWFRDFQSRGIMPNTVAYNRLISALGSGGQWQLALTAFEAMRASAADTGSEVRPDVITYGSLIAALERAGQWQRALQMHEEMQAAGVQTNTYIISSLINACERGGQFKTAVTLFNRLQEQEGLPMGSATMVARKVLYAFPQLVELMPAPLIQAARLTVSSGRAARQWIAGAGTGQRKEPEQVQRHRLMDSRPLAEQSMEEFMQ